MRTRLLCIVALALVVTACVDSLSPPDKRFGIIAVATYTDGASGYVMSPVGTFYDQTRLGFTRPVADSCLLAPYSALPTTGPTDRTFGAGAYLTTTVSGRTDSLTPSTASGPLVYRPLRTLGIPFTPGDTLRIDVPGATGGFPAATIALRTAESFTHDPVGVPLPNQDLAVTWAPAPAPGSLMTFSLRYANSVSGGVQNEQLFCAFVDDGSASVRGTFLDGWRTAVDISRSVRAVRLRSREIVLDSKTRLALVSTFGVPLAPLDP